MSEKNLLTENIARRYRHFRRYTLDRQYLPRWVVYAIDLSLCLLSFLIIELTLSSSLYEPYKFLNIVEKAFVLVFLHGISFAVFRTYSGIIRHSTFTDVYRLAMASGTVFVLSVILNFLVKVIFTQRIFLTIELILYASFSFLALVAFRVTVKETYRFLRMASSGKRKKHIAILGTDDKNIALAQSLLSDWGSEYKPIIFVSIYERFGNHKIIGLPVISSKGDLQKTFTTIKEQYDLDGILIVGNILSVKDKNFIMESAFDSRLDIFNAALPQQWHEPSDVRLNIAPMQIEDLLERTVIEIDTGIISKDLNNKTILVTGGAGSIGRELINQIAAFNPKKLIVLDIAETELHDVDLSLKKQTPDLNYDVYLGNIANPDRMEQIFRKYQFDVIYHAAAYKHVPMIEKHPKEGVKTNIFGTKLLAELAVRHKVGRFVMVSTDKAVNPTNVMGATKRAAEIYVQSLQQTIGCETKFITTRFGNVLGSNGSVIPFFKKQIENGGPVTVTHRDIIRYFMTIKEACQLVLQAGTMGKGGEIFVFDMGKPVRILDMAERMIKLCGLKPYIDIPIQITGLREGEKLYEELLNDGETTLPTYNPKIMVNRVVKHNFKEVTRILDEIEVSMKISDSDDTLVQLLKQLIPEYKSSNSKYEKLDTKQVKVRSIS